jgi:hypothetical protein
MDACIPDDVRGIIPQATSDVDQVSRVSSIHTIDHNIGGHSDINSEVSGTGTWRSDDTAHELTSATLYTSQSIRPTRDLSVRAGSDKRGKSVSDGEGAATRVLEALIRGNDEQSALLLANLRIGSSWKELAAQITHSADGREYFVPRTMHTGSEEENLAFGYDEKSETLGVAAQLTAISTSMQIDAETSLWSWLTQSFDRSYWVGYKQNPNKPKVAAAWLQEAAPGAGHITFAKSWNQHFGNLDLASAIEANNHSPVEQELQKGNLSAPIWAVRLMTYHEMHDPFSQAIMDIHRDCGDESNVERFCGPHAYIEALTDVAVYNGAPKLSQHLARLLKGIRPDQSEPSGLQYALMTAWWALLRWALSPSKTSYEEIPAYLRPSPWQYFVMHAHIVDFTTPLLQREYLCKTADADMTWIHEGCRTVECDWPPDITYFERDPRSGQIAMTAECKVSVMVYQ